MDMDLAVFLQHLLRLDLLCCAVGCVLYLPNNARRQAQLEEVLAGANHLKVLRQVSTWTQEDRVVPMLKQVQNKYKHFYTK